MLNVLADWERFVNERGKLPDLVQCALMHERFEAIHPFLDGNGRVGRLLITLFLLERSRLSKPLLYLSAFIEKHRQEYYDLLQRVRTHHARHEWVRFFLAGVAETSRQAVRQADFLVELRANWRRRLPGKHRARTLLDALFVNPYVTVASAASLLNVTQPTAKKTITALEEARMLRELTGRQWGKMYVAEEILDAIETPPEP
jgi:Fic family protein